MRQVVVNVFSSSAYFFFFDSLSNPGQSSDYQQSRKSPESFVMVNNRLPMKPKTKVVYDYSPRTTSEVEYTFNEVSNITFNY